MNKQELDVINQILTTMETMRTVLNEVSSYNCYGRNLMNKEMGELRALTRKLISDNTPFEITAEMVKELREQTGEGMMACKNVLINCKGDMVKAKEYLR